MSEVIESIDIFCELESNWLILRVLSLSSGQTERRRRVRCRKPPHKEKRLLTKLAGPEGHRTQAHQNEEAMVAKDQQESRQDLRVLKGGDPFDAGANSGAFLEALH